MSNSEMRGILFTFGNPLLDITADVDEKFLEKYGLEANNAILAEDKHKDMYADLCSKFKVSYAPGGATQNTARVMQWMLKISNSASYIGCIGSDEYGDKLEETAKKAGVEVLYQRNEVQPTGTCAVLVTGGGKNRSLCAYLAASEHFNKSHLETQEVKDAIARAKFFYSAGFPLTHGQESLKKIAEHATANNKTFTFNLAAPFLCQFFKEQVMSILPHVDVLFGNETEAVTFAEHNGLTEKKDLKKIAEELANLPKLNKDKSRIVVITQGADPTIIYSNGKITEHPVIPTPADKIEDTNGAGDAFVGGFLSQLVCDHSIEECVRAANYAANTIIQRLGCTYPAKPDFEKTVV